MQWLGYFMGPANGLFSIAVDEIGYMAQMACDCGCIGQSEIIHNGRGWSREYSNRVWPLEHERKSLLADWLQETYLPIFGVPDYDAVIIASDFVNTLLEWCDEHRAQRDSKGSNEKVL